MRTLNILICSSDEKTEQQMARSFTDKGVKVETSNQLINALYSSKQLWDFMLIDLNGLDNFLCRLLPLVRHRYPNIPTIGIRGASENNVSGLGLGYGLDLDAYLSEIPGPEELIVNFPHVAAKYSYHQTEYAH